VGITHSSVARLYERQADAYTTHGALGKAQKTVFEQLNWPGFPLQHSQQDSRGLQKVSNCKRALARKSFPSLKLSPVSAHPKSGRAEERKSGRAGHLPLGTSRRSASARNRSFGLMKSDYTCCRGRGSEQFNRGACARAPATGAAGWRCATDRRERRPVQF
jgi:hypothetical protein